MRIILIFLIVVTAISLKSYSQPEIDSLLYQLNTSTGQEKVDILNRLSERLRLINFNSAHEYAKRANSLSHNLEYIKGKAYAAWNLGYIAYLYGDFNSAIDEGERASELADQLNDLELKKKVYELMALVYEETNSNDQALQYFQFFFELNKNDNNTVGMGLALMGMARIYEKISQHDQALKNNLKALNIFMDQSNGIGITKSYLAIAKNYFFLDIQDSGMNYLNKAETFITGLNSEEMLLELYLIKNQVYSQNYIDSSLIYLTKSIELSDRLDRLYLKRDLLLLTSELYSKRGEYQLAYEFHQKYRQLADSLMRFRNEIDPDKLKLTLDEAIYTEQEAVNDNLQNVNGNGMNQNLLFIFIFGGIIIFISALLNWLVFRYKSQKTSMQKMNILNREISNLSSEVRRKEEIIHKLKKGVGDHIIEKRDHKDGKDEKNNSTFAENKKMSKERYLKKSCEVFILNHWHRLKPVIQELKLSPGVFSIQDVSIKQWGNINLNAITSSLVKLNIESIKGRIQIHHTSDPAINLHGHVGSILFLIHCILQNALESIPYEGDIYIDYFSDDEKITYRIIDTGIGIDAEDNKMIFKPFFSTKKTDDHLGLGLYISREIIKKHEAVIKVKSKKGVATEVTMEFFYD
jgi:hypothetical protein